VLDLEAFNTPAVCAHKLVRRRADQHGAWRGDGLPAEPSQRVVRLRGR
jgi:hypothetical protein